MFPKPGLPTPFGRYLLVEKLASGGMAEVFRAVLRGAAGFEKVVAVKRILPIFSEEPDFIALFQDEARIASTLTHANITQIFELGEVDGALYIALELVDGLDLGRATQRLRTTGQPMPFATAAFIIAEAARGLAHAHERRDAAGQLVGIVHRDVSPPNLLLSLAGEVKVADFGIAKAANKVHKTEAGVVMGKLRYMSPEQLAGEELDGRSDLFSLGVILYELLASGPIYPGDQSFRLAELIRSVMPPPPSTRNPEVPAALDAIVLRALAKRREDRYPTAADLARDLTVFVATQAPGFTREDLGALVASLAPGRAARAAHELPVDPHLATEVAGAPLSFLSMAALPEGQPETALAAPPRAPGAPARPPDRPGRGERGTGAPPAGPRPRRFSIEALLGLLLGLVIVGSGALVLVRFVLPGHDPTRPEARPLVTPAARPDAGPAAPEPPPTASFRLVPSASQGERNALVERVDRLDVTRRGLPTIDYAAYLTGLDTGLGLLVLDAEGRAGALAPLPPVVQALVARAGVEEAVTATLEAVRQTGELPPLVRSAARSFLDGRPAVLPMELVKGARLPPFAAAGLAVWLEPRVHARLVDLAVANDVLGRWCEPVAPPGRHFAPELCERAALVARLREGSLREPVADALERWERARPEVALGDGAVTLRDAAYLVTARPDELELRVTLGWAPAAGAAPTTISLLAAGVPVAAGQPDPERPGVLVWRVPPRLVGPVLEVQGGPAGGYLRLPPAPFAQ